MSVVTIVLAAYAAAWCVLAMTGRRAGDVAVATPFGLQGSESEPEPVGTAA